MDLFRDQLPVEAVRIFLKPAGRMLYGLFSNSWQNSANRMTRLISGMLQISLGGALSFEPVMKFGDICTHVQRTVNEVAPIAEAKGLNLVLDVTAPPEPLLFEFCQMEQLLANLLDNACRLTPRGGRITVKGFPAFWERRLPHVTE